MNSSTSSKERSKRAVRDRNALPETAIRDVLIVIECSLKRTIHLSELASVAGFSPYHFARLFKNTMGITPMEFVIQSRVERAKRMMLDDDSSPLASIASACGFADQSHLGRNFKRIVGVTPLEWRKRQSA
ncbi:MAG: helix-turn-helix domain-containing protein [Planctomycetota bacterium]